MTAWRWTDLKPVCDEIIRMDDRQSTYYALIGYCHAYEGDVDRALAAWDRYGAALPPNDPNPIDGRGDVLVANERYEEAAVEYRRNLELHPSFFRACRVSSWHAYISIRANRRWRKQVLWPRRIWSRHGG
jgi:tetratricopeptide (TPR) repeat protein